MSAVFQGDHEYWWKKDWKNFARVRDVLSPLHKALFIETSPSPAKYCLSRLGKCTEELRLPMVPVTAPARQKLDEAIEFAGLFKTGRKKLKRVGKR